MSTTSSWYFIYSVTGPVYGKYHFDHINLTFLISWIFCTFIELFIQHHSGSHVRSHRDMFEDVLLTFVNHQKIWMSVFIYLSNSTQKKAHTCILEINEHTHIKMWHVYIFLPWHDVIFLTFGTQHWISTCCLMTRNVPFKCPLLHCFILCLVFYTFCSPKSSNKNHMVKKDSFHSCLKFWNSHPFYIGSFMILYKFIFVLYFSSYTCSI